MLNSEFDFTKQEYHDKEKEIHYKDNIYKIYWKSADIDNIKKEIEQLQQEENELQNKLKPYQDEVKQLKDQCNEHLENVHTYNEIKDSCQSLIGALATANGLTIVQMHKQLDIKLDD
ncbi:hypothetical protein DLAC_00432 [Tieghemostelium lacteum]|uniref:DNA repair protein SWI5 homolog n=1 Tax=Tieghemostelium lacteum TaxID=361077 RepID=A0A152A9P7_TIELA|nr:hypothetical protein DLAC_00432 [Tieghemostelium lacteum]|eukprot:KYR02949.1 hypothetical protein DLAC_00432 [Tieghemostelium lacteum]